MKKVEGGVGTKRASSTVTIVPSIYTGMEYLVNIG